MRYYKILPSEKLSSWIQFFWVLEGDINFDHPFEHCAFADCGPEFIFYYKGEFKRTIDEAKEEKTFASGIFGQCDQLVRYRTNSDFGIFGVYLYPYVLPHLFSLSANELSNRFLDTKILLGKEGEMLEEQVMLAPDNAQRVKLVSDFFETRLNDIHLKYESILSSVKHIIDTDKYTTIKTLAECCNLSRRQFERKFLEYSGFSPKLFLRLARFNSIIKNPLPQHISLTHISYIAGYYDQSHFIHDFKKFSGNLPSEFFANRASVPDYRAMNSLTA